MEQPQERLTYKSSMGDYGIAVPFEQSHELIHKLADKLGAYEDIGAPEEFRVLVIMHHEYMAAQAEPKQQTPLMKSENCPRKRAVEQLDLSGNVIARFSSLVDAGRSVNTSSRGVWRVCNGTAPTHKRYKWRYCNANI